MKKILLSVLAVSALTMSAFAQPVCKVLEPASIYGTKPFTWADNWGNNPNFNLPGVFVQDTLVIAEDGTAGNSTTTIVHPLSQEGCSAFTNASAVAGKIAVVYRGTCTFLLKAQNALAAGAVAVLIINRDPDPIGMAGADPAINFPVVMIGSGSGQDITNAMSTETVVAFLGNKNGLNPNDLAGQIGKVAFSKYAAVPEGMLNTVDFQPSISYYNIGSANQTGTTVNCKITGPSAAVLYNETSTPADLVVGDSVVITDGATYSFPVFDFAGLAVGEYNVTYTVGLGTNTDDDLSDNVYTSAFAVTPKILSYTSIDASGIPVNNLYPKTAAGSTPGTYKACMGIRASDTQLPSIEGVHFSISSDTATASGDLTNAEVVVSLNEWADITTTASIAEISNQTVYLTNNADNAVVKYYPLSTGWVLDPNMNYLVCAQTTEHEVFSIGYDNTKLYQGNQYYDDFLAGPWFYGGATWTSWSGGYVAGIGVQMSTSGVSVENLDAINASVYPNPTTDKATIRVNTAGTATVVVTDLAGKVVSNSVVNFENGATELNTASFESGMYIVSVTMSNGASTKVNIVKK